MTEEIDVKKLTNDAFMAIDALFTDEDDMFSDDNEKEPDDFDLIQEYMLAIEWECSERNIQKFNNFLNKIKPKYIEKHNQDLLTMLTSIVRYLEKSKERALPETHNVMEYIVKKFKNINQHGIDEGSIKQERDAAYNKVLELKSNIAKAKTDTPQVAENRYQDSSSQQFESIENAQIIVSILSRLELCENRLAAMDVQNITLQQQLYKLTQLSDAIANLETKFSGLSDKIDELAQAKRPLSIDSNVDNTISSIPDDDDDDDVSQYDEINFDELDFDEMSAYVDEATNYPGIDDALDEIDLDNHEQKSRFEIDFEHMDHNTIGFLEESDDNSLFEQISPDEIEYDEITLDDLEYDETTTDSYVVNEEPISASKKNSEQNKKTDPDSDDQEMVDIDHQMVDIKKSGDGSEVDYADNVTPQYLQCFKIEDQIVALPDDKIYNIYKIPSKVSKSIYKSESVALEQFASFFQNLSKNMKGDLKSVSNTTLQQMDVDIHLLTKKELSYKMAVLCSFDNKVSIIPVTDIYNNIKYTAASFKDGQNIFSDYNVDIVGLGLIPFVPLCKK